MLFEVEDALLIVLLRTRRRSVIDNADLGHDLENRYTALPLAAPGVSAGDLVASQFSFLRVKK